MLASLPEEERQQILSSLTEEQVEELLWDWRFWARPQQIAPTGSWANWLALAGRGWGKTETGAQWIRERVNHGAQQIALVAETQKDLEEVMVSRILAVTPEDERPKVRYKPVRLYWPNGALGLGYNGTEPDQLRGPEFDTAWVDELAKYKKAEETWDMLEFTMRADDPRKLITTTPRNIPIIKRILDDPETVTTRGTTSDNAENLDPGFLKRVHTRYAGTRLGRQELSGEILEDIPGALWTQADLEKARLKDMQEAQRIVVAVDPSGADGDPEGGSDDIGIVVAAKFYDGTFGVLEDATCNLSPAGWGRRAVERYGHHLADCIVAEKNFGGAMVEAVIKNADRNAKVVMVTASRGKAVRAEPIAALYEQGRVAHAPGLEKLEEQMTHMTLTGYVGDGSPDRLDAAVWALTELTEGTDYNLSSWAAA